MKIKRIVWAVVICVLAMSVFGVAGIKRNNYAAPVLAESGKIFDKTTIEEDFADDSIIVVMDESKSSFGKNSAKFIDKDLFSGIDVKKINDLSAMPEKEKDTLSTADRKANVAALEKHFSENPFRHILHIELAKTGKQHVLDTVRKVEKLDGVKYVGVNRKLEWTDEPLFSSQWALNGIYGINAPQAWNVSGNSTVRVGIIDTGIASHEDLNVHVVQGYDFFNQNTLTTDDVSGHGTAVAGIIGAVHNGVGVAGIAPNVTLVPLQVAGSDNQPDDRAIIDAVFYAISLWGTTQQISILNASFSDFGVDWGLRLTVDSFLGLFVWSAGNTGADVDSYCSTTFVSPNIISVGAHDGDGNRSVWSSSQSSCYGAKTVDIFAPGGKGTLENNNNNIRTTSAASYTAYRYFNGTSAAAPHVAGVAALVLASYPNLTGAQVKEVIMNSGDRMAGNEHLSRYGRRLNAYRAMQVASQVPTIITTAQQLSDIRYYPSGHYQLGANINLYGQWSIIPELGFGGVLNGNGFTISGLTITAQYVGGSESFYGLFARNYGTIKGVRFTNVNVAFDYDQNSVWANVGAACGRNEGVVYYVRATGVLSSQRNYTCMGGIVGENRGVAGNCFFGDGVTASYVYGCGDLGGVVGSNLASLYNCASLQQVEVQYYYISNNRSIGGVVGYQPSGQTYDCRNYGAVRYVGAYSDSRDLAPNMAQIIGNRSGGSCWAYYWEGVVDRGTLHVVTWKGGFLNLTTYKHDQAQHVSSGAIGSGA
jgi:subtilisin family serine protease